MDRVPYTLETFRTFPLLVKGESKEIRQHPDSLGKVVIWLRPTIYSFTENRTAEVEGSNLLRARAMRVLIPLLKRSGIDHAYEAIDETTGLIIARKIERWEDPNVEVIVKRFHGGTSHHRYLGLDKHPTRRDHPFWPGETFPKDSPYGGPKIRFDWRNPFWNPALVEKARKGDPTLPPEVYLWPESLRATLMMRDEVLAEDSADELIDTREARRTALWTYTVLQRYLASCQIMIHDLCLFITSDGKTVYGEINQDCGRFRHMDYGELDKDVWRAGGSVGDVLAKWKLLCELIEKTAVQE